MTKHIFSDQTIYSKDINNTDININQIVNEFHENSNKYTYTHYINKRWENIYLGPQHMPSISPLLSLISSIALKIYKNKIKPHQTLIIPHEMLGYEKNEYWFNSSTRGQSTRIHNHINNAFVSGVFYLKVPDNSPNIFFKRENKSIEIEVNKGKLILFQSDLDHYVPINKSNDTRLSLAFNLYLFPITATLSK